MGNPPTLVSNTPPQTPEIRVPPPRHHLEHASKKDSWGRKKDSWEKRTVGGKTNWERATGHGGGADRSDWRACDKGGFSTNIHRDAFLFDTSFFPPSFSLQSPGFFLGIKNMLFLLEPKYRRKDSKRKEENTTTAKKAP